MTGDDASARLTILKEHINDTQRMVCGKRKWPFLEITTTITTAADTSRYELPADTDEVMVVKTTEDSGSTYHLPKKIHNPEFWDYLQSLGSGSSDVPEYWYIEDNDLLLYPAYATAGHTISVRHRRQWVDMSMADYTTGTITTVANGDETVTGSGSSWTGRKPVLNQHIRLTPVSGKGDFRWYRISSITSDTVLELEKKYVGDAVATASCTYAIGEMPYFPGIYHNLCVYRPMALYYMEMEDINMANTYWRMYDGGKEAGISSKIGGLLKEMMDKEMGGAEFAYFGPEDQGRENTPEENSLNSIIGESW